MLVLPVAAAVLVAVVVVVGMVIPASLDESNGSEVLGGEESVFDLERNPSLLLKCEVLPPVLLHWEEGFGIEDFYIWRAVVWGGLADWLTG